MFLQSYTVLYDYSQIIRISLTSVPLKGINGQWDTEHYFFFYKSHRVHCLLEFDVCKNRLHPVKLFLWVNKRIKRLATRIIETQVDERWSTKTHGLNSDNSFSTAVMVFIRVSVKMWIQQYNCNLAVQQTQKLRFSIVLKRSTVFIERKCCCRLQQGHCKNKGSTLQNLLEVLSWNLIVINWETAKPNEM